MAYVVLDLTATLSEDPDRVRGAWMAMNAVVSSVIVPLALASLVTGLVISLGTRWGLFRHWWVLISFLLTVVAVVVLWSETGVIRAGAQVAADPETSVDDLLALPGTLLHSIGGLVVLLLVQVLNVVKPQGLTPYGWRKQQEERRRSAARLAGAR